MIFLEVDGVEFTGFTDITVSRRIDNLSGTFSFSATSSEIQTFPIKRSQSARVIINNIPVITGFIDRIEVSYSSNSHTINITGRDSTSDIIDSTLIGAKDFNAPIALEAIIRKALDDNGLNNINIINKAGTIKNFEEGEFVSASNGQTIFEFIEQYARKRQVLLSSDGDGSLVLIRGAEGSAITSLVHDVSAQTNNVLSANVFYDDSQRFNQYRVVSQLNTGFFGATSNTDIKNISDSLGLAVDCPIRNTRILEIVAENSSNKEDAEQRAIWEANIRRARASEYTATVQGFFQDQALTTLWKPNIIIQVKDDFANVNSSLLINGVEFNLSLDSGSITKLSCIAPDAYTLQAEQDEREAKANQFGNDLF